jgi:hypothetical protein
VVSSLAQCLRGVHCVQSHGARRASVPRLRPCLFVFVKDSPCKGICVSSPTTSAEPQHAALVRATFGCPGSRSTQASNRVCVPEGWGGVGPAKLVPLSPGIGRPGLQVARTGGGAPGHSESCRKMAESCRHSPGGARSHRVGTTSSSHQNHGGRAAESAVDGDAHLILSPSAAAMRHFRRTSLQDCRARHIPPSSLPWA